MNLVKDIQKLVRENLDILKPTGILLVVLVGLFLGIIPAAKTTWDIFNQNRDLETEVSTLQRKVEVLRGLDELGLKKNITDLSFAIPTEKSLATIFATIDGLSTQTGVSVQDISFVGVGEITATASGSAQAKPAALVGETPIRFSLSVEGTPSQVQDFFRNANAVRRLMGIRSFDLSVSENNLMRAKVEMEGYYKAFPTNIGAIGSPVNDLTKEDRDILEKISSTPNYATVAVLPPITGGSVKSDPFSP